MLQKKLQNEFLVFYIKFISFAFWFKQMISYIKNSFQAYIVQDNHETFQQKHASKLDGYI